MNGESLSAAFEAGVRAAMGRLPVPGGASGYAVAYSGGLDSGVLLAVMARLGLGDRLRALHVDHGLHADSADWARHCERRAAALGVRYLGVRVEVADRHRSGLEAAAREARYQALARLVEPGEVLLTAHHANDQLETVLLRMLRGSGVRGLRGILGFKVFARGYLARPLLAWPRAELRQVADAWGLKWLEDPSNLDIRHDRNRLRAEVVPPLTRRWPAAPRLLVRLAARMDEAETLLGELAAQDAGRLGQGPPACRELLELSPARTKNLLRWLIRRAGLPLPSGVQLDELMAALAVTRQDAQPCVSWPGAQARIWRGRLYLGVPLPPASAPRLRIKLARGQGWQGPEGCVELVPAGESSGPALPDAWLTAGLELRFRVGGERFHPAGHPHSRPLKQWLQEAGVVPWMRDRIPLLWREDRLIAIGDRWVSEQARAACAVRAGDSRWRVIWSGHPPL
jgi:tRNA(Ile)-lysidine synthase